MDTKLPPVPQEYYEDNRTRFNGEMSAIDIKNLHAGCKHYIVRKSGSEIECRECHNGWIDAGRFLIKDGAIIGSK